MRLPSPGGARCDLAQQAEILARFGILRLLQLARCGVVQLQVCRIDPQLQAGDRHQLFQLLGREGGLGRAAAGEQADFIDAAGGQRPEGMIGNIGLGQLLCGQHQ